MLWTLVVCLAVACSAEYSVRCSDRQKPFVSVTAATDGTAGRYIVEFCTAVDPSVTKWQLNMGYLKQAPANCTYDILQERFSGAGHSYSLEDIDLGNLTCPRVCFSKAMDLMFRSCYRLDNTLYRDRFSSEPLTTYYYADNNITEYKRDNTPQFVTDIDYDTMVSFQWLEGHIPITEYEIMVCPNDTHCEDASIVTRNCTREARSVRCVLHLPLGCYELQLRHKAPWTRGLDHLQTYLKVFCHTGATRPGVAAAAAAGAGAGAAWWAGGAALALLAAAGALLALRLSHVAKRNIGRLVRDAWLARHSTAELEKPIASAAAAAAAAPAGCILLVYARDCAPAMRLAAELGALLEEVAPGQVYELYSARVTALAARSPADWVRSALLSAGSRVVLLQTPALAALQRAAAEPAAVPSPPSSDLPKLCEPLLGRAVYRRPQFGDALLQFALQLLAEVSHTQPQPPYKKYFLATVSEMPVDLFPTIVPYTRYELPAAGAALAHALRPGVSVSETTIHNLAQASNELLHYATKENPHYLADLLQFL